MVRSALVARLLLLLLALLLPLLATLGLALALGVATALLLPAAPLSALGLVPLLTILLTILLRVARWAALAATLLLALLRAAIRLHFGGHRLGLGAFYDLLFALIGRWWPFYFQAFADHLVVAPAPTAATAAPTAPAAFPFAFPLGGRRLGAIGDGQLAAIVEIDIGAGIRKSPLGQAVRQRRIGVELGRLGGQRFVAAAAHIDGFPVRCGGTTRREPIVAALRLGIAAAAATAATAAAAAGIAVRARLRISRLLRTGLLRTGWVGAKRVRILVLERRWFGVVAVAVNWTVRRHIPFGMDEVRTQRALGRSGASVFGAGPFGGDPFGGDPFGRLRELAAAGG